MTLNLSEWVCFCKVSILHFWRVILGFWIIDQFTTKFATNMLNLVGKEKGMFVIENTKKVYIALDKAVCILFSLFWKRSYKVYFFLHFAISVFKRD